MEGYIYSDNKKTKSIKGKTLFDFADTLIIRVPTSCRRNGECHECIVQVSNGRDNLETKDQSEDFLTNDYRLACQAKINIDTSDIKFNVLRRQPKILEEFSNNNSNKNITMDLFFKKTNDYNDKADMLDHYMSLTDQSYTPEFTKKVKIPKCVNCNIECMVTPTDGILVCQSCGDTMFTMIENDKPNYKEPIQDTSYFYILCEH